MCNHDESDLIFPGVCVSCEWDSPTELLERFGKFLHSNAAYAVIAFSAVFFALHLYWWWVADFKVVS